MSEENHIENSPLVLLDFLKEISKTGFNDIQLPFKDRIVVEHTFDSITAIKGCWINSLELIAIISSLGDNYNVQNVNFLSL